MSLKSNTLWCKQTCRISENAQLFSLFHSWHDPSVPASQGLFILLSEGVFLQDPEVSIKSDQWLKSYFDL